MLTHFSFSSCNFPALTSRRNTVDPQDIRALCIHFLVALLMFGDKTSIRQLLQTKNVFGTVISGLIVDRPELIQLFLSTLLDRIVKNSSVSKTLKIQLFNQTALKQLVRVLEWNGLRKTEKEFTKEIGTNSNVNERSTVADAVLQFLLVVCSSRKYGIVFQVSGW